MFKILLKSKGEIEINLYNLSVGDVRSLLDTKKKQHEGDEILGKAVGMTAEELADLSYPDYRKLTKFFWECVNDPLKDEEEKNSQSESI